MVNKFLSICYKHWRICNELKEFVNEQLTKGCYMGWYSHPDTMTMAQAKGWADQTGHPEYSLVWTIAYRIAYQKIANGEWPASLKQYLDGLDKRIKELSGMEYKGYSGSFYFSSDSKVYVGRVLGIKDVIHFQGDTIDDLNKAFKDSIDDYLEFCKDLGDEPEKPTALLV